MQTCCTAHNIFPYIFFHFIYFYRQKGEAKQNKEFYKQSIETAARISSDVIILQIDVKI